MNSNKQTEKTGQEIRKKADKIKEKKQDNFKGFICTELYKFFKSI